MSSDEELPNDADVLDTDTGSIYGYNKPDFHDIEPHFLSSRTLDLVASNAASVAWLKVCHGFGIRLDSKEAMCKLGSDIGKNTHLRWLEIWGGISHSHLLSFITSLTRNQTIEYLILRGYSCTQWDIVFQRLQPFIEQNRNFRGIEITSCRNLQVASLTSTLLKSQTSQLKRIDLHDNSIGDKNVADLIYALNAMSGLLLNLLDLNLNKNKMGKKGCTALTALLKNTTSRIHYVAIGENDIDDECLDILIGALVENYSLKTLDLGKQGFLTPRGWQCLSTFVSNPNCSIENLMLAANNMRDECFISLGHALSKSKSLKSFHLDEDSEIIPTGWQGCS